jgi:HSP20 family molecular chaperone IbpA
MLTTIRPKSKAKILKGNIIETIEIPLETAIAYNNGILEITFSKKEQVRWQRERQ